MTSNGKQLGRMKTQAQAKCNVAKLPVSCFVFVCISKIWAK